MITYFENKELDQQAVLDLYNDANWTAYTKDVEVLMKAINNSLYVLTAWHENELVGLIRIVGDGVSIVYIQDILVLKSYKKQQIGTALVTQALARYNKVRQTVLLTDDNQETRGFYESLGFESCDKGQLVSFTKIRG